MSASDQRRSAGAVGGSIETAGDGDRAEVLAEAWHAAERVDPDELTHGFHPWPARMLPGLARAVVESLTGPAGRVVDPFCGGGTVLVEALRAGRPSVGVDLNPLAVRVCEVRCAVRDAASRDRFLETLVGVGERSEERVRPRVDARPPLRRSEARWYDGHVLKELAGLREEILAIGDGPDRRALEVLLSAIVVKFSRQRSDTAERVQKKRIRKGLPTEFLVRKGRELARRWEALEAAVPRGTPAPRIVVGDARRLPRVLGPRRRADLILTSPPYGGTYDYVDHHARRYPWLGIDARALARGEVGARRNLRGPAAAERWDEELSDVLRALARSRAEGGRIVLVLGDAQLGRRRVRADAQVRRLAPKAGLEVVAAASQPRPDPRGGRPRREHLLLLE